MDFVDKNIEKYVEALSDNESLLKEISEYIEIFISQGQYPLSTISSEFYISNYSLKIFGIGT